MIAIHSPLNAIYKKNRRSFGGDLLCFLSRQWKNRLYGICRCDLGADVKIARCVRIWSKLPSSSIDIVFIIVFCRFICCWAWIGMFVLESLIIFADLFLTWRWLFALLGFVDCRFLHHSSHAQNSNVKSNWQGHNGSSCRRSPWSHHSHDTIIWTLFSKRR